MRVPCIGRQTSVRILKLLGRLGCKLTGALYLNMAPQRCMGLMINLFLWKEIVPQRIYYLTNDLYLKCFSDSNDKVSLSNCVDNT